MPPRSAPQSPASKNMGKEQSILRALGFSRAMKGSVCHTELFLNYSEGRPKQIHDLNVNAMEQLAERIAEAENEWRIAGQGMLQNLKIFSSSTVR
jgi:hypothetical protein